jgi:hypothetical protein
MVLTQDVKDASSWQLKQIYTMHGQKNIKRKPCLTPSLNMPSENPILTAVHWTGKRGPGFTANWNSGERFVVCRLAAV